MISNKLIHILSKMSKHELNDFRKYVYSPIFNKHEGVIKLCDIVLERYSKSGVIQLEREEIQMEMGIVDKKYFNRLVSLLLGLLNDFLGFNEYRQDLLQNKLNTIKALRKRTLLKPLNIALKQYQTLQSRFVYQDTQQGYKYAYEYFSEKDSIFLQKASRQYDENLQLKNDFFDLYYISSKLEFFCEMLNRETILQAKYKFSQITPILTYIEENQSRFEQEPIINAYYTIYKMLSSPEDNTHFFNLKLILNEQIHEFTPNDYAGQKLFDYAHNYCIKRINEGVPSFYQEFLSLYKMQLESEMLFKDGFIEEWDFKNIVTAGVRAKEFEWTEEFIRKMKRKLRPEIRENAYTYNLAMYYHSTQQYGDALQLLFGVTFTNITYHLGAKLIQLQIYYQLDESDAFNSIIEAFRIYVKRNRKLSNYRKEVYFNFLKVSKRIERLKSRKGFVTNMDFAKEKHQIETFIHEKSVANLNWIREIVALL